MPTNEKHAELKPGEIYAAEMLEPSEQTAPPKPATTMTLVNQRIHAAYTALCPACPHSSTNDGHCEKHWKRKYGTAEEAISHACRSVLLRTLKDIRLLVLPVDTSVLETEG